MLRNREIRRFIAAFLALAAAFCGVGFAVSFPAGIVAAVSAAAFGLLFWGFTRARYRRIAQIAEEADLVLHNAEHLFIAESEEGELSVLQSEIVKMTQRIREQNAALRREKGRLADSLADIAHQLCTPLTSASLILSLLENHPEEDQRKELLWEIKELFSQMDWLLTSLLKLSRLDAGVVAFRRERIPVRKLLDDAVRPLLFSLELHDIALHVNVPEGAGIWGDPGWLPEAVRNILKNCMESAGDGGRIDIDCEETLLYTQITVHDSGAGIPKEELRFLFDRFYRGKNADAAGYGIGLALCRTIIVRQGGTVSAGNHPQGGAVFTVRFNIS